ncbi:MAG TPA: hypothetical protein P5307_23915, partial [Pirellulaceae bacterium]|nr:hypothetical protein [Pirellulaceae bacterium]
LLGAEEPLANRDAETLVVRAARHGAPIPNAAHAIGSINDASEYAALCEAILDDRFSEKCVEFETDNELRCRQQETSAQRYADRRISTFLERIDRFKLQGNDKMIPPTEGLIRRERDHLDQKLSRIAGLREVDLTVSTLATGIILIERSNV